MTTYEKELKALWQAHLKPRRFNAPTVISLFAGCGGSSLGYSAAGFREVLAVEYDATAVESFLANFPEVPIWGDDIGLLSVDEALSIAQLKRGELNLLDFSPPCQADSRAGNQDLNDPRSRLWKEATRLLEGMKPKHFVMEAVPGLISPKLRPKLDAQLETFHKCGYQVVWATLCAADFGVPQKRRRVIFHGVRNDLNIVPLLPSGHGRHRTVADAWAGLPPFQYRSTTKGQLATLVTQIKPGRTGRDTNLKGNYFSTKRLAWEKPAFTVCAQVSTYGGLFLHPDLDKGISVAEVARLQSFPDEFQICGRKWDERWQQIGNAVPPLLAKAIGEVVMRQCLDSVTADISSVDCTIAPDEQPKQFPLQSIDGRNNLRNTESGRYEIIDGNCLDHIPKLPDHSIAACITSPPYAMQRKKLYGGIHKSEYPAWTVRWMQASQSTHATPPSEQQLAA